MKLGVFYAHLLTAVKQTGMTLDAVMANVSDMGYEVVECSYREIQENPEGLRRQLEQHHLAVASVYVNFDFNEALPGQEELTRIFDKILAVGAAKMLIIPGFYREIDDPKETEMFCQGIRLVCEAAQSRGIQATLEDYDDAKSPCCRRDQLVSLCAAIPSLKVAFDTGNFEFYGEDAMEAYPFLRTKICHVHMKDRSNTPVYDTDAAEDRINGRPMYPVACGLGIIKLPEIIEQLVRDGYDGFLSAEFFNASDMLATMQTSAERIKAMWDKAQKDLQEKESGKKAIVIALLCLLAKIVTGVLVITALVLLYFFGPLKEWIRLLFS